MAVEIPLPIYFVAGKPTSVDGYKIIGNPAFNYTTLAAAEAAAIAELGLPNNYYETAVVAPIKAFRNS